MDVKIDCPCGTRYGFDVEPEHGQMPTPVACPSCGQDGTGAANAFLRTHLPPTPASVRPMRITLGAVHPPAVVSAPELPQ